MAKAKRMEFNGRSGQAIMALGACWVMLAGSQVALADDVVDYQAAPIVITADTDAEAMLFALPANAPKQLIERRRAIEALRTRLEQQRAAVLSQFKDEDWEEPMPMTTASLTEAIKACEKQALELEEVETSFLIDKELYLADGAEALR